MTSEMLGLSLAMVSQHNDALLPNSSLLVPESSDVGHLYKKARLFQLASASILLIYTLVQPLLARRALRPVSARAGLWLCVELLLQMYAATYSAWLIYSQTRRAVFRLDLTSLLYPSFLGAAIANGSSILLGFSSNARIFYHGTAVIVLAALESEHESDDSVSRLLRANFLFVIGAAFLLDAFQCRQKSVELASSDSLRNFSLSEKISYGWLSDIIAAPSLHDQSHLPDTPLPEDFAQYVDYLETSCAYPGDAASNILWSFVLRHHSYRVAVSSLLRLIDDGSKFALPWLLQSLLANPSSLKVAIMFCSRTIGALCGNYSGFILREISVQYRSALSAALHNKTLRLGDIRGKTQTADLCTLSEVDALIMYRGIQTISDLWTFPLQVILCLGGLAWLLPYRAFLAVLVIMSLAFPILRLLLKTMSFWIVRNLSDKDRRAHLVGEVVEHIQSVKMHGWETAFVASIGNLRKIELKSLQSSAVASSGLVSFMQTMPSMLTVASFGMIIFQDQTLTNELVFTAIMLFTMLNASLMQISGLMTIVQAIAASSGRIHHYATSPETKLDFLGGFNAEAFERGPSWNLQMAGLSWPGDEPLIKTAVPLSLGRQQLMLVTGNMGSGKSTLLLSLARHLQQQHRNQPALRVAYVSQSPVLLDASIRNNILLGKPYDQQLYKRVVEACALDVDFLRLPSGDRTLVAGSAALSGGQCARICLARAAYYEADVYLLDDPLAALDIKVANHIINRLLGPRGLLNKSRRLLSVTDISNQSLVAHAQFIYRIDNQALEASCHVQTSAPAALEDQFSEAVALSIENNHVSLSTDPPKMLDSHTVTVEPIDDMDIADKPSLPIPSAPQNPILDYIRSAGRIGWPTTIALLLLARLSSTLGTYVLKTMVLQTSPATLSKSLGLYSLLSFSQALLFFFFVYALYRLCIVPAAGKLHQSLVCGVLALDLSYFQTHSAGETLNLFTSDISRIDGPLNASIAGLLAQYVNLAISCGVLIVASPASLVFVLPLLVACHRLQQTYLSKLRELRHMDAESRAPLLSYLQGAEKGHLTFSIYDIALLRKVEFADLIAYNLRAAFPLSCLDIWLGVRLEVLSVVLQTLAISMLLFRSSEPGTLGFVMTYVFQVTGTLSLIAKMSAQFEADSVSVARVAKFSDPDRTKSSVTLEAPSLLYQDELAPNWPEHGRVQFDQLSARHRPGLPITLDAVSFCIAPGEKVAVVGRTGAGKSSLVMSLLRLMDLVSGQIYVDQVDISKVDPALLRQRLALMPQAQSIFSGTIRSNLDPLGRSSDDEIYQVLKGSGALAVTQRLAKEETENIGFLLDTALSHQSKLSKGEVQLLALARATLQKSSILILDEATSGMDLETEEWMHRHIREAMKATTVLAIMHRLDLTFSYDKVLILDHGRVVAFDSPAALYSQAEGHYFAMLKEDHETLRRAKDSLGLQD